MQKYPFNLLNSDGARSAKELLKMRPSKIIGASFEEDARRFVPGEELETAINTSIAVGEPLLVTGEPGTGKTQAAYYAAYKLEMEPVIRFQVKSDSVAKDLLYHFDTIRYFHDSHIKKDENLDKSQYVEHKAMWRAIESDEPRILLIDEIDKAPRDFPNDLLHELDRMEFEVPEIDKSIKGKRENRPLVFITSNSERRLPEPFLRRCVYHHIPFDGDLVKKVVKTRRDEYPDLSEEFLEMAVERFLALRESALRKLPSTAELLAWLRVLGLTVDSYPRGLDKKLSELPHLGALIKDSQDLEELRSKP